MQENTIKIGVHNGKFHADDVFCVTLLKRFVSSDVKIVRTRDERLLAECDYVLDVGNREEVNDRTVWLDHHQDAKRTYDNGVIYAACGKLADYLLSDNPTLLGELRKKFLWPIEATDNGQEVVALGLKENLLSFVSLLNCTWQENLYGPEQDKRFAQAVDMAYRILSAFMERYESYELANKFVKEAIAKSINGIVVLDQYVGGWSTMICRYNAEHPENIIKIGVVKSKDDLYLAQAINESEDTFATYVSFPWKGLSGDELTEVSGIHGGVFCHNAGFLCGFTTQSAAIQAAKCVI